MTKIIKALERIDPAKTSLLHRGTLKQHIERYKFALKYTKDKLVLDAACGTGYGTELISKNSKKVIGIDISEKTIEENIKKFGVSENKNFIEMNAAHLKFNTSSFDTIVSFETIEHLKIKDITLMISEFHRVLKKNGILIISTPDVRNYSLGNFISSNNFHQTEFTQEEFLFLFKDSFKLVESFYQDKSSNNILKILNKLSFNKYISIIFQKLWRAFKSFIYFDHKIISMSKLNFDKFTPMYLVLVLRKV
jgi:ubiquinone/menaquinone biosynthesis C-methylase UbiE